MSNGRTWTGRRSNRSPMTYLCGCGKKWLAPGPIPQGDGTPVWECSCGTTLTMRNGVIYAPATDLGKLISLGAPRSSAARGGG